MASDVRKGGRKREQEKEGGKYRERQGKNSLLEFHFFGTRERFFREARDFFAARVAYKVPTMQSERE